MPTQLVRRRDFVTGLGAIAVFAGDTPTLFADERVFGVRRVGRRSSSSGRAFPAIAAASMPENLEIGSPELGIPMRGPIGLEESLVQAGYVELRRYRFHGAEDSIRVCETFIHGGLQPLLRGEAGDFLFGFETLASREKAWRELNSAPQWLQLRAQLVDVAIYKVPN
jgi:hypothetical protein